MGLLRTLFNYDRPFWSSSASCLIIIIIIVVVIILVIVIIITTTIIIIIIITLLISSSSSSSSSSLLSVIFYTSLRVPTHPLGWSRHMWFLGEHNVRTVLEMDAARGILPVFQEPQRPGMARKFVGLYLATFKASRKVNGY